MVVAGLTGGIATGKSTVAAMLASAGAKVVDADRIARDAVRPGTEAHAEVVARFGAGILRPDGAIDRPRLAAVVFADPAEKRALEGIVHPRVRREIAEQLQRLREADPGRVAVVDVPLLFETGMDRGLRPTIVVYAPEDVQLRRLIARDGLAEADALRRIRTQMPIEAKRARADIVIDNSGPLEKTRRQALEVYGKLAQGGFEGSRGQGVE
jgi:dephospho-CoA kinase